MKSIPLVTAASDFARRIFPPRPRFCSLVFGFAALLFPGLLRASGGNPVTSNNDPQISIGQSQAFVATGTFAGRAQRQLAGAGGSAYPLADLPSTRGGAAAAESGNKLYVIGGLANGEANPSSLVEAYDPAANTWSPVARLGRARTRAGAASIAGKIYVVGGCAEAACTSNVSTVEVYDPSAPSPAWTTVSSTGFTARNTMAVGVIGGKLYVAGGNDDSGNLLTVLEVYNPASDSWSSLAAMPPISQPTGGVIAGKFYVEGSNAGASVLAVYDPSSNTWASLAGMATAAPGAGAAVLNSKLYVVAGQNISEYDPTGNAWRAKHSLMTARWLARPVTIGNLFYVAGNGAAGQSAALEGFAPDEVIWSSSNTGQVTVDQSGWATGSAVGSVQIIATSLGTPAISGQAPLRVISAPAATTVSLTTGTNPSLYGETLTFTATVTGSGVSPSGSVAFYDGGTCASPGSLLGTAVLVNASAAASSGKLAAVNSPHTVLACYSGDANYTANSGTVSQTVNVATVIPSVTVSNKVYDGCTTATIATRILSGVVGSDDVTLSGGTASFADAGVGTAKTVTATGLALSGAAAGNYQLSSTWATATADVIPEAITVTADAKSKAYGNPDPPLTYQVTSGSLFTGDSFTGAPTRLSGESVGTYAILQGTLALNGNYVLTYAGNNLTITPPPDFTLTGNTNLTVVRGTTATADVTVVPILGLSGTVALSCSGAPSEASCSFSPSTVAIGSRSTLTVTTTAPHVLSRASHPRLWQTSIAFLAFGMVLMLSVPGAGRRSTRCVVLAALVLVLSMVTVSCGGGGFGANPTTRTDPGTPTGTYVLTITATCGSGPSAITHTYPLQLTVQ
jgi:N-acetylneuraminic acid mutarotase